MNAQISKPSETVKSAFAEAWKWFPKCCIGAWENQGSKETVKELYDAATHEMDLFLEQQDGCITKRQALEVDRFIKRLEDEK